MTAGLTAQSSSIMEIKQLWMLHFTPTEATDIIGSESVKLRKNPNYTEPLVFMNRIELRALEKISVGEELTVSYIDFLNVSEERRRQLKQQYFFDCQCEYCKTKSKDDLMSAVKETDGKQPSVDEVKEVTEFTVQSMVIKISRECLQKQESVFADTNLHLLRILCVASEALAFLQQFQEAAAYTLRLVEGYAKLYHCNNAQLGLSIMRAGVTHWHAGLIQEAHELICKAYAILMITHGTHHPISRDLETMRRQTEQELRLFKQDQSVYRSLREAVLQDKPLSIPEEPVQIKAAS
ncbi:hypothetical protein DNTS_026229 [Danionella cerebrum]|uniref:SET domain-containing protein n=1 Tax=Danionella cerebrum TaxID=2873325 RepID=A0A553NLF9_9TELE|nr:hypothetical protein DNTS_026229 [Danionella translucida]